MLLEIWRRRVVSRSRWLASPCCSALHPCGSHGNPHLPRNLKNRREDEWSTSQEPGSERPAPPNAQFSLMSEQSSPTATKTFGVSQGWVNPWLRQSDCLV